MREKVNATLDKLFEKPIIGVPVSIVVYFLIFKLCGLFTDNEVVTYLIRIIVGAVFTLFVIWFRGESMYVCGFKKRGLKNLIVIIPFIIVPILGTIQKIATHQELSFMLFIGSLVCALEAGVVEETMVRGIPLGNTLWRDCSFKKMILLSIYTAFIFGILHFGNIDRFGNVFAATLQVVNALAAGFLFAVIYLRTGSIIPGIIAHALWDFNLMFSSEHMVDGKFVAIPNSNGNIAFSADQLSQVFNISAEEGQKALELMNTGLVLSLCVVYVVYALILLRKSKREEILENFRK